MPLFRASLAVSLDGYIATPDGGADWLHSYFTPEIDFGALEASFGATVVGRKTYDLFAGFGGGGKSDKPTIVLTHRPIPKLPRGVEAYDGDLKALADRLRRQLEAPGPHQGKDIWLMGGGSSIRAFHALDLVDRWEISVIPMVLGDGIPLFPRHEGGPSRLRLTKTQPYSNGIVALWYERDSTPSKPARKSRKTK